MPKGVYDRKKNAQGRKSPGSGRTKASYTVKSEESKKKQTEKARKSITKESNIKTGILSPLARRTRRIEPEVQDYIKEALMATDETSKKTYMMKFIDSFLAEARKDPTGKAGMLLASSMFNETLLTKLDAATNKAMATDKAFTRYRIRETLFERQKEVFDNNEDEEIEIICSRRAGKTELNARILCAACIEPDTPCLYINLTFTNAISQLFGVCLKLTQEYGLDVSKSSSNDGSIEFTNGSKIVFRGNANSAEADKHRGNKYKLIIIDEVGHQRWLKYLVEDILSPLQKDFAQHKLIYTGTPPRAPHHYSEWLWNNPKIKHYHWTLKDNPYIPNAEEIIKKEAEKRGMDVNNSYIQREYLGIMGAYDTESQVYKGYQVFEKLPSENFIPTDIFIGVDWGGKDNNAIAVLMADRYSRIGFVPAEFKKNNMCTSEICNEILTYRQNAISLARSMNRDFDENRTVVIPDTNEPNTVYELQKIYHVPNVQKPYKHDLMWGVGQLQELVRSGIIKVLKGGIIADEFDQILYKRDEDSGVILNELDDDIFHGDIEAALRYASRHFCELILGREQLARPKTLTDARAKTLPPVTIIKAETPSDDVIWD